MTLRTAYTKTHIKGTKDSCKSQWGKLKRVGKRTDKWVPEKVLHKILDFFFFLYGQKGEFASTFIDAICKGIEFVN